MKILSLLLWTLLLVVTPSQPVHCQNGNSGQVASADSAKESVQDGLKGPVRRVRVEIAKVAVKNGKLTEEGRIVREVTTYDVKGSRLDKVVYPVESSSQEGTKQFRHDNKGNILEMVLLGDGGVVLAKETYQYEFDALGNWRKMTASIGIYEDGKLSLEPIEITYRTIAYFYNDAVQKISAPASQADFTDSKTEPTVSESSKSSQPQPTATSVTVPNSASLLALKPDNRSAERESTSPPPVPAPKKSEFAPATSTPAVSPVSDRKDVRKSLNSPSSVKADTTTSRATGASSSNSESLYKQGVAYLATGQAAKAVESLQKFVYANPEDVQAYSKLGMAYVAIQQYKDAVAAIKMAIKIRPDRVDALTYYYLGLAYDSLNKYSDSVKAFKQALMIRRAQIAGASSDEEVGPPLASLHYNIGLELNKMGNFSEASKELRESAKVDPKRAETQYALGMVYLNQFDRRSAEKQLLILKELNSGLAKKLQSEIGSRSPYIPPGCTVLPCQ